MGNWTDVLVSVLPMVLLIGAWWFFLNRMRSPGGYQDQSLDFMRRQTEALERIAVAAERRND